MNKSDYDDMGSSYSRKEESSRKAIMIVFGIVLVLLITVVLYVIFTPMHEASPPPQTPVVVEEQMSLDIPNVDEVVVERSNLEEEVEEEEPESVITYLDFSDYYTVKEGDTLSSIAEENEISADTLFNVNKLRNSNVNPGAVLIIPPYDGIIYRVQESDTIESLSERFNFSRPVQAVLRLNGISEIRAGEEIFLPIEEEEVPEIVEEPLYIFPSDGEITYTFGQNHNGRRIEGVVFRMNRGDGIRAVMNGFVMDSGTDPIYGRYVSIMHSSVGFKSTYYGLEIRGVTTGQEVKMGDVIGSVGQSNFFGYPALYFVLEQNSQRVDPVKAAGL